MQSIANAKLIRQSYGIATAGMTFGGPRGIWLECTGCDESQQIVGSTDEAWASVPDSEVAKVFRRNGWSGIGHGMFKAKCPACSKRTNT